MSTTRCKAKVWKKEPLRSWNPEESAQTGPIYGYMVQIGSPQYDSDPNSENGKFFQATPAITIQLGVVNPGGAAVFEEGDEIYVDFTPCKQKAPTE